MNQTAISGLVHPNQNSSNLCNFR